MNFIGILITSILGIGLGWATYYALMRRFTRTNVQHLAMQGMVDGMLLINPRNRIDEINDSALEILGVSRAQIQNKNIASISALEHFARQTESRQDVRIGENWYEFRLSPMHVNKTRFLGKMLLIHDINNRKLAEEMQRAFLNDIQALQEIHLELSELEEHDPLYIRMIELARARLNIDRIGLFLLNMDKNLLVGTFGVDDNGGIRNEKYYTEEIAEDHWTGDIVNSPKRAVIWHDAPLHDNHEVIGRGWKSAAALWNGEATLGYIVCDCLVTGRPAKSYEAELIAVLGSIYGHLIENLNARKKIKLLNQRLEHMAMSDSLTGIYNRRFFINRGSAEFSRCKRHNTPLSIVMFDIDHFKSVNDEFGHEKGDMALVHTTNVIRRNLREIDVLCRTGGEEFSILALNTDLQDADMLAERLRKILEEQSMQLLPNRGLTISVGVASFHQSMQSIDDLVHDADLALYEAKHAGRNCVKTFIPD